MHLRIRRALLLFALIALHTPALAQQLNATLEITQNSANEVIAHAYSSVDPCGVDQQAQPPTFSLEGHVITVIQEVSIADFCLGGPYDVTLDFGRLPDGTYTINWNVPSLTATYAVTGDPGFQIGQAVTGSWFDPSQSGHGFDLQVLATQPPQLLATWLVFDANGKPAWITGTGPILGSEAVVQAAQISGPGAFFPPHFNSSRVSAAYWGSLTFSFSDCNTGVVNWVSSDSSYGSGSLPITRLTQPAGISCP